MLSRWNNRCPLHSPNSEEATRPLHRENQDFLALSLQPKDMLLGFLQGLENIFWEGADSNDFWLSGPYGFCHNYSTLP